jgi:aminoglycoside phosphotransferase (APT) family kinase protein
MVDGEPVACLDDARLRGLEVATDPGRIQGILDRAHGEISGGRPAARWSCRLLRHHPGSRAVLLYAPERGGSADAVPVVGKVYAKRHKAQSVWAVLCALAARRRDGEVWRSPRPLARLSEWNLVLMEHLPGTPLRFVVCAGESPEREERGVRLAARALAELHRVPGQGLEARSLAADRGTLERRVRRIEALDADLARRMAELSREIAGRAAGLPPCRETTFLHGSSSPKQMLLDGDRVGVLDFDGARRGDPAIDVGTFMASLRKYGTRWAAPGRLRELAELFLEESCRLADDAALAARARLVQAQELLNFAARGRLVAAASEAVLAQRARLLLEETEACLASD